MKNNFAIIKEDRLLRFTFYASVGLFLFATLLIAVSYQFLNPFVPFLNSLPWGKERLVAAPVVFLLPIIFLVTLLINYYLGVKLYTRFVLISRILAFNALLVIFFGFLAYIQMLFLVY